MNFRSYFDHLFERPGEEVAAAKVVRDFAIWFFNLLRNFVLVGLLKYFYDKTGSPVLFWIHKFALFIIFIYCVSYVDQWYVNLFGFLENKRTAHRLNLALNVLITIALFILINKATGIVVGELSAAHASAKAS
jgi:hypothetical protein